VNQGERERERGGEYDKRNFFSKIIRASRKNRLKRSVQRSDHKSAEIHMCFYEKNLLEKSRAWLSVMRNKKTLLDS